MADCKKISVDFFLNQQGWPSYIIPISVLSGIFAYAQLSTGPMKPVTWIMVFLVVFLVYLILQIIARMCIPENTMSEFIQRCERCNADPLRTPGPLTITEILSYSGKQPIHEGFDAEGNEVPVEHAAQDTSDQDNESINTSTDHSNSNSNVKKKRLSEKTKKIQMIAGDQVTAPSIEQYSNFSPYDVDFIQSSTDDVNIVPPVLNNTNEVPQIQLVLTPGEIQEAQALSSAPIVYNTNFAPNLGLTNGSDEIAGFDPMPANKDIMETACMSTNSTCGTMCSGDAAQNSQCTGTNLPVPGPQWQPQRASVVQSRLMAGNYTATNCPITY